MEWFCWFCPTDLAGHELTCEDNKYFTADISRWAESWFAIGQYKSHDTFIALWLVNVSWELSCYHASWSQSVLSQHYSCSCWTTLNREMGWSWMLSFKEKSMTNNKHKYSCTASFSTDFYFPEPWWDGFCVKCWRSFALTLIWSFTR